MKKFDYYLDGKDYGIGELEDELSITGLGYRYQADNNTFVMGNFTSNEADGWICISNDNEEEDVKDSIYFYNANGNEFTEGLWLVSNKHYLGITQTDKHDKVYGYGFYINQNGSWSYEFQDDSNETRAIQYHIDDKKIKMVYLEDGEITWSKEIAKGVIDNSFLVPFHHFKSEIYPDADFNLEDNYVEPVGDGPFIIDDPETNITNIGIFKNKEFHGIIYTDGEENVSISQLEDGKRQGGHFSVNKETYDWTYMYFDNNECCPIVVNWYWNAGVLEIKNYKYTDSNFCDCIQIDKDFNVRFIEGYNAEKQSMVNDVDYIYDDVYNSKKTSSKTTKTKKKSKK